MFQVLRSSAGAGKTHALVKHYLTHCLGNGNSQAYRLVLALTFTSKAANEMKERVLRYLERLSERDVSDAGMRDVMEHLLSVSGVDEDTIAARAQGTLNHMLNHWSDVAISTIDAFTRKVVRPFARDLRLDQDLRMTTEHDWYMDRAVEDVIAEAGVNPAVTQLLTEACRILLDEESAWDPERSLRELGKELEMERSIVPLNRLNDIAPEEIEGIIRSMRERNRAVADSFHRIGTGAITLISDAGLTVDDLHQTNRGFFGFFRKLADFGGSPVPVSASVQQVLEKDTWWSGKASATAKSILSGLGPELRRRLELASNLVEKEQRGYFVRKAILNQLPTAFTLRELRRCLEQRKEEDGVVFFSDLTRRVAELVRDEPVPFIYERVGERYRHFLIDEFQDTSLLQWTTLLPLIQNALGSGGTALLVGDAKQAIYRWRNGEVRLFLELPRLFARGDGATDLERERALVAHHRPTQPLLANYRSSDTVVSFNNALFGEASTVLSPALRKVYEGHDQSASNTRAGLVHLERLSKEVTGDEATIARTSFLLNRVAEAVADGFEAGDIAVLVRTAAMGREAAEALTEAGYGVLSPEGLRLAGDPLIESVIELMGLISNATVDGAVRAQQQLTRLRADSDTHEVDPMSSVEHAQDLLQDLRKWLLEHNLTGVRSTLTDLIARLFEALGTSPASDARALSLLDEAHLFSNEHGPDLEGFLAHWERKGNQRNISMPDDGSAIQVMTVHKAKGLEFPVVIMPSIRMSSSGRNREHLWIDSEEFVPELPYALVNDSSVLRAVGVAESEEEQQLSTLDALDLLYVAFTRPVQRLYGLVPERGADEVTKVVLAFMERNGAPEQLTLGERCGPWEARRTTASEPFLTAASNAGRSLVSLREEAPESWDPADPDPLRSHGNLVHSLFSKLRQADDLEPVLAGILARGEIGSDEAEELKTRLLPLLHSPALAPWFAKGLEVRTEAAIITTNGHVLRPDRVVIEQGKARVLDLKTGAPQEKHRTQVKGYMGLLKDLGYQHVQGALLYLSSGTLEPVVP